MNIDTDKEFNLSMHYNRSSVAYAKLYQGMLDLRNAPPDTNGPGVPLPEDYCALIKRALKYVCEEGCHRAVDSMQKFLVTAPRPDIYAMVYPQPQEKQSE